MTKIKAVIFDLDGVLVDAKEWHYEALNRALGLFGFKINREAHVRIYDGLPTKKKLQMLSLEEGFPSALCSFVSKMKQQYTQDEYNNKCKPVFDKQYMLSKLNNEGYRLACCSNSIRESVTTQLSKSGIMNFFEFYFGNDEGLAPKPDPALYLAAIDNLGLKPEEIVIVEDMPPGIEAAKASGAHVCEVKGVQEVNYSRIKDFISKLEAKND
ncbi:HAD family phosphatase [Candidatus Woesearchaeota archaeon]|jgi:beta-phosphoglucomutase|nr:HAD family phosphatase [Candidatus Woesearchaeota archaeon]